jgi:hypothetical protein
MSLLSVSDHSQREIRIQATAFPAADKSRFTPPKKARK